METIKEDYVSFETAKLLKEKRFDESCYQKYDDEGYLSFNHVGYINSEKSCNDFCALAPTLQMAMKWLREIHNIFIEISVDEMLKDEGYQWALYYNDTKEIRPYAGWRDSYEEACEEAIKYSLENLI